MIEICFKLNLHHQVLKTSICVPHSPESKNILHSLQRLSIRFLWSDLWHDLFVLNKSLSIIQCLCNHLSLPLSSILENPEQLLISVPLFRHIDYFWLAVV